MSSKTRPQGGSVATTIPAEVSRRMGLSPGDELYWVDDGRGGYRVTRDRPDIREVMEAHERALEKYSDVFRSLAE